MNGVGFMESKKSYNSFELSPVKLNRVNADETAKDSLMRGKTFLDTVYSEERIPFSSAARRGFLPGVPVHVSITDAERAFDSSRLNPYLYTIELSHGPFRWTIRKRYHHLLKLHTALMMGKNRLTFSQNKKPKEEYSTPQNRQTTATNTPMGNLGNSGTEKIDDIQDQSNDPDEPDRYERLEDDEDTSKTKFPKLPDMLLSSDVENVDERRRTLEAYLQDLLKSEDRNNKDLLEFFEVSEYSFIKGYAKRKEGMIKKRTGDNASSGWMNRLARTIKFLACNNCGMRWKKSWILIDETCIIAISPKSGEIRTVLLFDRDFARTSGIRQTGIKNSVLISNYSRSLWIKTFTQRNTKEWVEAIEKIVNGDPARAFIQENRYSSYAPLRFNQVGQWFVDGEKYMSAVATAIEQAKEEIFITDWWLSPEIHLKRGIHFSEDYRLDRILKKKSAEGVRVFILLYKEFQLALSLNSFYTKKTLMTKGGKNIKVLRHPDRVGGDVNDFLWAHHEKVVVIDQAIAFVGGIDLCYGRWDTNQHPLTDVDTLDKSTSDSKLFLHLPPSNSSRAKPRLHGRGMHVAYVLKKAHEVSTAPIRAMYAAESKRSDEEDLADGCEAEHVGVKTRIRNAMRRAKSRLAKRSKSFRDATDSTSSESSEFSDSEFEDSDTVDSPGVTGSHHKHRRKSRVKRSIQKAIKKIRRRKSSTGSNSSIDTETSSNANLTAEVSWREEAPLSYFGDEPESCLDRPQGSNIWKGKDYVNFIVKDIARPDLPEVDNVDRRTTPRMPWHDIAVMVAGKSARDVARHFIQRWNAVKNRKAKFNPKYPCLVPKSYSCLDESDNETMKNYFEASKISSHKINCQVLRSCSLWSAGIDTVESSIHSAMISVIQSAQHYIYIENQFFITSVKQNRFDSEIKNGIGNAIFNRIQRAHREQTPFKVFLLVPLLPAFEGQIGSATSGNAIRAILHYMYASICRGDNSLFRQLEKAGIPPLRYVSVCSLRTWGELLGTPVTELVYIHSKLMICDDRIVICGSANINDRSLLGTRDSEVCLMIEDTEFSLATFNGVKFESGRFAGSLRRKLMREHLGLETDRSSLSDRVIDPLSESFWKDTWLRRASINTKLFDESFLILPNDQVRTLEECKEFENRTPLAEVDRFGAFQLLKKVKGNLVLWPFRFLENENLLPSYFAKEGIVPAVTWT